MTAQALTDSAALVAPFALPTPSSPASAGAAARNTKIVCTLGPATDRPEMIANLIRAGANVFRLNFSHGTHDKHAETLAHIRQVAQRLGRPVAVLQDLCGPKIRISRLAHEDYMVRPGDMVRVTTQRCFDAAATDDPARTCDIASTYSELIHDVRPGDAILLDDGRIELEVESKEPTLLVTRVRRGGKVLPNKGINLPGVQLSTDSVTAKDWRDLDWGVRQGVDLVALSFVRRAEDLLPVRTYLDQAGSHIRLIAKIERPEAIDHIEGILALADGLMVARGDLGVETDLARVPLLQKSLIRRARLAHKPVITATQMLESMVHDSTPTRAEVSDVANAICDGTDAVMLSAETASGSFPVQAVQVLHEVATVTESGRAQEVALQRPNGAESTAAAVVEAAATTALLVEAKRVIVYSQSGLTARLLASCRLPMPVVAVTNVETTYRQLALSYGVQPLYLPNIVNLPQLLEQIDQLAHDQKWATAGHKLVVVSALDGRDGSIDTLHVHRVVG